MKAVRLMKVCLNETYCRVRIGKYLFDNSPIQNGLKQRSALSQLLFVFALGYIISKIQENQLELKLNEAHRQVAYAGDDSTGRQHRYYNVYLERSSPGG
jgi:hypothetical protein